MNIAVIPARGGSQRIPRKNIKLFHGLPIIAYAIKAALASDAIHEVFVSTDDEEIAEIAISFGAQVPWLRSKELSDDYVSTISVMKDAVVRLNLSGLENICCIYPTVPLLKPIFLSDALKLLEEGNWNYVFSGTLATTSPQRLFSLGANMEVELLYPEYELTRTQDIEKFYGDAGQFYWGRKSSWESGLPIFSSFSTIFEIPRVSAVDIDTLEDWHYAETLFKAMNEKLLEIEQ